MPHHGLRTDRGSLADLDFYGSQSSISLVDGGSFSPCLMNSKTTTLAYATDDLDHREVVTAKRLYTRRVMSRVDLAVGFLNCAALIYFIASAARRLTEAQTLAASRSSEEQFLHAYGDHFQQLGFQVWIGVLVGMFVCELTLLRAAAVFFLANRWSIVVRRIYLITALFRILLIAAWIIDESPGILFVIGVGYVVVGICHIVFNLTPFASHGEFSTRAP